MVLIEFYGTECHFCKEMDPLVTKLEKEEKVKIQKLEVWHNSKNAKKMEELDKGFCGGVPLFINTETGKKICGSTSYTNLRKWASGK